MKNTPTPAPFQNIPTPGPWVAEGLNVYAPAPATVRPHVAKVVYGGAADARLIAAAPELLACVKAELALYDSMLDAHPRPGVSAEAKARMDAMRAAISKATGA